MPDHLAPVFAQFPLEVERRAGRVPAHAERPQGARSLWRSCRRRARLRSSALGRSADSEQARSLCFQSNAVPLDVRRRAATRLAAVLRPRPRHGLLRQLGRGSERERAEARLQDDRRHARSSRSKAAFTAARPRRARSPGARSKKWYGFPREAVRREVHQADATSTSSARSSTIRRPPSSSSRCKASPARSTCRRNSSQRCASAAARTARS